MRKSDGYWKKVTGLLFLGWFVIWVYRTMLTPIYAEIQQTVGLQTGAAMGLISSCYFFGYVLTQIPGGMLMDRFGRRNVLTPSFLVFGLGVVIVSQSRSMSALYLGSVLAGVGTGTYYSGAFSLSAETAPAKYRFLATAIVNNGCAFGMIGGILLGTRAVKQGGLPWQWMCLMVAALAFAMSPLCRITLRDDAKAKPDAGRPESADGRRGNGVRGLFSLRHLSTYLFYFATCYGYYMIATWLPAYLASEKNLTGSALGLASTIVALVSIPGSLFIGRMLDRFKKHKISILVGLQIWAALMLLLVTWVQSLGLIILALMLYGLTGKQAVDPVIVPHVTSLNAGNQLSTGLGVFNFFGMSASVFAPSVTGLILDALGSQTAGFYLAGGMLAASSVIFLLANLPRRRARESNGQEELS